MANDPLTAPNRIRAILRQWKADMSQLRKDFFTDFAKHRARSKAITREAEDALAREMALVARRFPVTESRSTFDGGPLDYRGGDLQVWDPFEWGDLVATVRDDWPVPNIEDALDMAKDMETEISKALESEEEDVES